jgi:hypothetical protein
MPLTTARARVELQRVVINVIVNGGSADGSFASRVFGRDGRGRVHVRDCGMATDPELPKCAYGPSRNHRNRQNADRIQLRDHYLKVLETRPCEQDQQCVPQCEQQYLRGPPSSSISPACSPIFISMPSELLSESLNGHNHRACRTVECG